MLQHGIDVAQPLLAVDPYPHRRVVVQHDRVGRRIERVHIYWTRTSGLPTGQNADRARPRASRAAPVRWIGEVRRGMHARDGGGVAPGGRDLAAGGGAVEHDGSHGGRRRRQQGRAGPLRKLGKNSPIPRPRALAASVFF